MECEICGAESKRLYPVIVEGSNLLVCRDCKETGTQVKQPKTNELMSSKRILTKKELQPLEEFSLAPDYAIRIRNARQKLNMTIKELSQKVFEKESVLHKIEKGKMLPDKKLKEKLEHVLNITLADETDQ